MGVSMADTYYSIIHQENFVVGTIETPPTEIPEESLNNIALLGFNGLETYNYTASTTYYADHPAGAFDGYTNASKLTTEDIARYERGTWISNYQNKNQWLSIDFNENVNIFKLKLISQEVILTYNRTPKNVIIQSSLDGVTFNNEQSFLLEKVTENILELDNHINTRYLRFFIVDNYGNSLIQIGEIEIY